MKDYPLKGYEEAQIAALAIVSTASVRRAYHGEASHNMTLRILRAARDLGLPEPATKRKRKNR